MFSKQVLPYISFRSREWEILYLKDYPKVSKVEELTLKVARASEAISKFGSSTYLKNSSKLVDSNRYLKEHYKIKMHEKSKPMCHRMIKGGEN